jgi:hypothetical protein
MKLTPINIPTGDFILFIGTSHTFGQCSNDRLPAEQRWSCMIAEHLGVEVLSLGFPGTDNLGLLQAVNELIQLEVFNEHCKMVVLEPRFGSHALRFNNDINTKYFDELDYNEHWWNIPRALSQRTPSTVDKLFTITGLQPGLVPIKGLPTTTNEQSQLVSQLRYERESGSPGEAFKDATIIQTIKNIITNLNGGTIKFSWLVIDDESGVFYNDAIGREICHYQVNNAELFTSNFDFIQKIYGDWLNIFEDRITTPTTQHGIIQWATKHAGVNSDCGHLNELGNKMLFEQLSPVFTEIYKSI